MHKPTALLTAAAIALFGLQAVNAQTVATVDGAEITQAQLDAFAEGQTGQKSTPENRQILTERLIDLFVLSNAAVENGFDKDADVAAQIELQRRGILAQATVTGFLQANPVAEEEVQAEYDRAFLQGGGTQQYKARHILLETEDEAKAVIESLKEGADFAALAQEKSTGPSAANGGDLGWFTADTMVPEFSVAVIGLENGQFSQAPTQTQFGYHVILREDSRAQEPPPYDEVKVDVRTALERQSFQTYLETLREQAKREITQ